MERTALLVQAALARAGVALTIKDYAYRSIFAPAGPIYGGKYDLALYSTTLNWDPDAYNYLACDRWYPRGQNVFRFCDPALDELEAAGLDATTAAGRARIYAKASRRIWSLAPYIPVYQARRLVVRSSDLRDYSVNPTSTPWWDAWQWDI